MIICGKQIFDPLMLDRADFSEFMKYLSYAVERELTNKLIESLQDHNLHIVKLGESRTEDDVASMMVAYRQEISDDILVQCENCKYNPDKPHKYYDDDLIYSYIWCPKFIEELNGKGFCPFGKDNRVDDEP